MHLSLLESEISGGTAYSRVNGVEYTIYSTYSLRLLPLPLVCDDDQYFDGIKCNNNFRSYLNYYQGINFVFYFSSAMGYTLVQWIFIMGTAVDLSLSRHYTGNFNAVFNYKFATNAFEVASLVTKVADANVVGNKWIRLVTTHDFPNTKSYCLYVHENTSPTCAVYNENAANRNNYITFYSNHNCTIKSVHLSSYVKSLSDITATQRDKDSFDFNIFISTAYANTNFNTTYGRYMFTIPHLTRASYRAELYSLTSEKSPLITCPSGYYYGNYNCTKWTQYVSALNTIDNTGGLYNEMFNILNTYFSFSKEVVGFWVNVPYNVVASMRLIDLVNTSNSLFNIYVSESTLRFYYNAQIKLEFTMPLATGEWYHFTYAHHKNVTSEYQTLLLNGVPVKDAEVSSPIAWPSSANKVFIPSNISTPSHKILFVNIDFQEYTTFDDLIYLYINGFQSIDRSKVLVSLCHLTSTSILSATYPKGNGYEYIPLTSLLPSKYSIEYPIATLSGGYYLAASTLQEFVTQGPINTNFTFDCWIYCDSMDNFSIGIGQDVFEIGIDSDTNRLFLQQNEYLGVILISIPYIETKKWHYVAIINNNQSISFYVNNLCNTSINYIDAPINDSYNFIVETSAALMSVHMPRLWSKSMDYQTLVSYKLRKLDNNDPTLLFSLTPFSYSLIPQSDKVTFCDSSYQSAQPKLFYVSVGSQPMPNPLPYCDFTQYYNGLSCVTPQALYIKGNDYSGQMITNNLNFDYSQRLFTLEGWANLRAVYNSDSYFNPVFGLEEFGREGIYIYYSISVNIAEAKMRFESSITSTNKETDMHTLSSSDWHHFAIIVQSSNADMIADAELLENITIPDYTAPSFKRSNIAVGRTSINSLNGTGLIAVSNIRLWSIPFTPSQLKYNMNNRIPFYTIAELPSYYDFSYPYAVPYTVEDYGYMSNWKFKMFSNDFSTVRGLSYIDNAINKSLGIPFIECPTYFKYSLATYQCEQNMQFHNENRKSIILSSQSSITLPINLLNDVKSADFTIEFWIKFIKIGPTFMQVLSQVPMMSPYISIRYSLNSLSISTNNHINQTLINSACGYALYGWHHISMINSIALATFNVYNDLTKCGYLSVLNSLPLKKIVLFNDSDTITKLKLREFRLWHSEQSIKDIERNMYNMIDSDNMMNLLLYYKLNEGSDSTLYESINLRHKITLYEISISTILLKEQLWGEDYDISICDSISIYDATNHICTDRKIPILYSPKKFSILLSKTYSEFTFELWIKQYLLLVPLNSTLINQVNHFSIMRNASGMTAKAYTKDNNEIELSIAISIEESQWAHLGLSLNNQGLPLIFEYNGLSSAVFIPYKFDSYASNPIILAGTSDISIKDIKIWRKVMSASELYALRNKNPLMEDRYIVNYIPMYIGSNGMITDYITSQQYDSPTQYYEPYYGDGITKSNKYEFTASANTADISINGIFEFQQFAVEMWIKLRSNLVNIFEVNDLSASLLCKAVYDNQLILQIDSVNYSTGVLASPLNKWIFAHFNFDSAANIFTSLGGSIQQVYTPSGSPTAPINGTLTLKSGDYSLKNLIFYSSPPNFHAVAIDYMSERDVRSNILKISLMLPLDLDYDGNDKKGFPLIGYFSHSLEIQQAMSEINYTAEDNSIYQPYWALSNLNLCPPLTIYSKGTCISTSTYLYFKNNQTTKITLPAMNFGENPYSIEFWYNPLTNSGINIQSILKLGPIKIGIENKFLCWDPNGTPICTNNTVINDHYWMHISIANGDSNNGAAKISFNAKTVVKSSAITSANINSAIEIGDSNSSKTFDGIIAYLQLWKQYNPNGLIKQHMNKDNSDDPSLIAYYPLTYYGESTLYTMFGSGGSVTMTPTNSPNWVHLTTLNICPCNLVYSDEEDSCIVYTKQKQSSLYLSGSTSTMNLTITNLTEGSDFSYGYWILIESASFFEITIMNVIKEKIQNNILTTYNNENTPSIINHTIIIGNKWVYSYSSVSVSQSRISKWIYTVNREIREKYQSALPETINTIKNGIIISTGSFSGYIRNVALWSGEQDFDTHTIYDIFDDTLPNLQALLCFYPLNETFGEAVYDISPFGIGNPSHLEDISWKQYSTDICLISAHIVVDSDWKHINITYNRDIEYRGAASQPGTQTYCGDIFDSATYTKLASSNCTIDLNQVRIDISDNALIVPGNNLIYNNISNFCSLECDHRCLNATDPLLVIPSPNQIPYAEVKYPQQIESCNSFQIKVFNINGTLRRNPRVQYLCTMATNTTPSVPSDYNCTLLNSFFNTLLNYSTSVTIPIDTTIPDGSYTIRVIITNILGTQTAYTINILTSSIPVAEISIIGQTKSITIFSSQLIILPTFITKPDCSGISSDSFGAISWVVMQPALQSNLEYLMNNNFTSNYTLTLPPGTLKENTVYQFKVIYEQSYDTILINVKEAPIIPITNFTTTVMCADHDTVLSFINSYDSFDLSNQGILYLWSCIDSDTGAPCIYANGSVVPHFTSSKITLLSNSFEGGKSMVWNVDLSKILKASHYSGSIAVSYYNVCASDQISLQIQTYKYRAIYSPDEIIPITLSTINFTQENCEFSYEWKLNGSAININQIIEPNANNVSSIHIKPNQFSCGNYVQISANTSALCNGNVYAGNAGLTVKIACGPSKGTIILENPQSYPNSIEYTDEFGVSFYDWVDNYTPFTYRLESRVSGTSDDFIPIMPKTENNHIAFKLNTIGTNLSTTYEIRAKVCNYFDVCTFNTNTITIFKAPAYNATQVFNDSLSIINAISDLTTKLYYYRQVCSQLSNLSDDIKEAIINQTLDYLTSSAGTTIKNNEDASTRIELIYYMSQNLDNNSSPLIIQDLVSSLMPYITAPTNNVTLNPTELKQIDYQRLLEVVSTLSNFTQTDDTKSSLDAIISNISNRLLDDRYTYLESRNVNIITPNHELNIVRIKAGDSPIIISKASDGKSIEFPNISAIAAHGENNAILEVHTIQQPSISSKFLSRMRRDGPSYRVELKSSLNLSSVLQISSDEVLIKISNAGIYNDSQRCTYYDNVSNFYKIEPNSIEHDGNSITCSYKHFSEYYLLVLPSPTTPTSLTIPQISSHLPSQLPSLQFKPIQSNIAPLAIAPNISFIYEYTYAPVYESKEFMVLCGVIGAHIIIILISICKVDKPIHKQISQPDSDEFQINKIGKCKVYIMSIKHCHSLLSIFYYSKYSTKLRRLFIYLFKFYTILALYSYWISKIPGKVNISVYVQYILYLYIAYIPIRILWENATITINGNFRGYDKIEGIQSVQMCAVQPLLIFGFYLLGISMLLLIMLFLSLPTYSGKSLIGWFLLFHLMDMGIFQFIYAFIQFCLILCQSSKTVSIGILRKMCGNGLLLNEVLDEYNSVCEAKHI